MEEKKEKKETSKGVRIFIIILLTPLFLYFMAMIIFGSKKAFESMSNGDTSMLFALLFVLALAILSGYGIIKNISKLRGKELTAEQLQKRKKKQKTAIIIMVVIIVGIVGGISLPNIFNDSNTNIQKETLDQYAGTWNRSSNATGYKTMLILDGKGNFTEKTVDRQGNTTISSSGTYKIENDTITLDHTNLQTFLKIKNANTLDILNSQGKPTYMQYKR